MVSVGAASGQSSLDLTGTVFEGRFRIEQRIAEGGFAVVYKAYQVALDRWVALKVLKAPRSPDEMARAEFRDKFASEARTIARIQHRHIVEIYDFAVSTLPSGESAPWMALQWLDGETLATYLARRSASGDRGLPAAEAFALLKPVLQALAHAHKDGIVHRDIKPANIMMTPTPAGLMLRVLDFGIAKIMADDHPPGTGQTRTESVPAFSPAYAAPEQVTFSRTGPWTDVHALGLILSELMTGTPPYLVTDPDAHTFERIMSAQRPTPASQARDVGAFEPVLAKALALIPRERWKNASEFLEALERAANAPAKAGVPRKGGRFRKGFASVAAAVVLLLAAAVLGLHPKPDRPRPVPASPPPPFTAARAEAPAPPSTPQPQPPPPAVATPPRTEPRPKRVPARRTVKPAAPTAAPASDGRDLFDDTK